MNFMSRSKQKKSLNAKANGQLRGRRQHRAERREATKEIREKINAQKVAEGHPGWTGPNHNYAGDLVGFLRSKGFTVRGDDNNGTAWT
jgi:hypothetical protein